MKRCPQCGAEYDDHDTYCFVDGAELAAVVAPAPAPAPAVRSPPAAPRVSTTPRPAPSTEVGGFREPVAPPPARGLPVWALVLGMGMFVVAFAFIALAATLLIATSPTPTPTAAAPRPSPLPPTPVAAAPSSEAEAQVTWVAFESDPPGAIVYEEDKQLCMTPCRVQHPEYAPPTRTFVLKASGHPDTPYTMTDPTQVQKVELAPSARPSPRGRPKGGSEEILIQR
jgi:hypothetical protein